MIQNHWKIYKSVYTKSNASQSPCVGEPIERGEPIIPQNDTILKCEMNITCSRRSGVISHDRFPYTTHKSQATLM